MTIRKMLLLVIPALFILNNAVSYFIFQSGRTVQQSYNVMLERVLLYKQIAGQAQLNLRALNGYLADRSESSLHTYSVQRDALRALQAALSAQRTIPATALIVRSYRNMIDSFTRQEAGVVQALSGQVQSPSPSSSSSSSPLAYAAFYEEAERTAAFIQEEGYHLVDAELSYYQPIYRQIFAQTKVMNYWGVAIFILNTLISVLFAYWISLRISRPIGQLALTARQISDGNLQASLPRIGGHNEFGMLVKAFGRMQDNLKKLIVEEKKSLEKDKLLKELELEVLQNQMNPHFLFNSLNVLSRLALLEGAEQTSDLTVSMSNLLRYNLRKLDRPVTLRDEVEHAKEYFTLQQARFRDRIQFVTRIDEKGLDVWVPLLTLQPILENVFVHGIEGMEEGAKITLVITCEPDAEEVAVTISDNGVGMSEEVRKSLLHYEVEPPPAVREKGQSTGLGTRNVFKRLELFYGRKNLVDIRSKPGEGTSVILKLPAAGKEGAYVSPADRR